MDRKWDWVDRCLLTAIACLSGYLGVQIAGLGQEWWRSWPRAGAQVCQQYVGKMGGDADASDTVVDYLLYLPPDYYGKHNWPLVVFLHGAGERGVDLEIVRRVGVPGQIEAGRRPDFILASPQCPPDSGWAPETILALVEHLAKAWSVDRDRVYLTGFSMGGFGTWQTACLQPERLAAIAPLAGGGEVEQAERLVRLPIWAFHGAKDDVVPLKANEDMVEAVRRCGGQVQFTVYPELGHGISEQVYQDSRVFEWLLAQRRGQGSTACDAEH